MAEQSAYMSPKKYLYYPIRSAATIVANIIFRRKILQNDISDVKGPFVVIGNHECALDPVNLMSLCKQPLRFVISRSFYNTIPLQRLMDGIGMIQKQQFQPHMSAMKEMKAAIKHGDALVLYPAGLMPEDGVSTPIPSGTAKFLKWIDCDIYVARIFGSYFVMPKWGKGFRSGKTYISVTKLFAKEELKALSDNEANERMENALMFDAYADQEKHMVKYSGGNNIQGLENVLYICPKCKKRHTLVSTSKDTLVCSSCGFEVHADKMGFLSSSDSEFSFKHPSDWSQWIEKTLHDEIDENFMLSSKCKVHKLNTDKKKYLPAGEATVSLSMNEIKLEGKLDGEDVVISHNSDDYMMLPFTPGKCFDYQDGLSIYRCFPENKQHVIEFIKSLKVISSIKRELKNVKADAVPEI